jgi:hypothetical protein
LKSTLGLAAGIVALVSSVAYLGGDARQALPWPEIDIVAVAMRMADEGFLTSDVFTNASAQPNPRWIHAWLVHSLSSVTGGSPIAVIHALRALLALALPALFIVSLARIRELEASVRRICPPAPDAAFRAFVTLLIPAACFGATSHAQIFSVAVWSPVLGGHAAPSNIALLLGSLGILLHERRGPWLRGGGLLLLFCGGLVHPLTGPALTAVYVLFKVAGGLVDRRRVIGAVAGGIVAPMVTIALVFAPESSPSVGVVTEVYAYLRHPHHYVPSMFGSLAVPWAWAFALVCAILLVNLAMGARLGDRYHARAAGLAFASYAGAVLAQYVFVEVIPVKSVVLLGPSRFTLFGYWLAAILTARLVLLAWSRVGADGLASTLQRWARASSVPAWSYRTAVLALWLVAAGIAAGAFLRSSGEFADRRRAIADAWSWATRAGGHPGAVVALPPDLDTSGVREVAGLALLVDGYFPFDLDAIESYGERYAAVYGRHLRLPPQQRVAARRAHYDGLGLREIVEIGRRWPVDFWVMHNGAAAESELVGASPVIRGDRLEVYEYADLVRELERRPG